MAGLRATGSDREDQRGMHDAQAERSVYEEGSASMVRCVQ